jgi:hypothetical protein
VREIKITSIRNTGNGGSMEITALLGPSEFKQLRGFLANICVFPTEMETMPASFTKTGSRHNNAKWLLLPRQIRKQLTLDEFDFSELRCASVSYRDMIFVVYGVPKKSGLSVGFGQLAKGP